MSRAYIPLNLRRFVSVRADGLCEYCLLHQDDTLLTHPIDHIIAVKHEGETAEINLAYSCLECNRNKGSDIATFDPLTGALVPLFNPRIQEWHYTFELIGARIIGRNPIGRATTKLLQFNEPDRVAQRRALIAVGRYPLK